MKKTESDTSVISKPLSITVEYLTKTGYRTEILHLEDAGEETVQMVWEENASVAEIPVGANIQCITKKIATIGEWPEFKTEWKNKRIKVPFDGHVSTKLPQLFRRICKKTVSAKVCYPADFDSRMRHDAEECATVAAIAAVAAAIASGASGALPVFKASFEACMAAKIGDLAKKVRFGVYSDTEHGRWIPV